MNYSKDAYCRLCANLKPHNELVNLQTEEDMCEKIVNKLSRFNIVMDLDELILPKTVCFSCTKSLDRAFNFVTAVEQAQVTLSDFILIQINNTHESNMEDDHILVETPDEDKPATKDKHSFDYTIDVKYEDSDSDINVNSEEYNVEIIPTVHETPNIKTEDDNNIKDEIISCKSPELNSDDENARNDDYITIETNDNKSDDMDLNVENYINKETNISIEPSNVNNNNKKRKSKVKYCNSEPLKYAEYTTEFINKEINRLASVPHQHIKKTWMDFHWKCAVCETEFPNFTELRNHSMENHNSCNSYVCPDCNTRKIRLNKYIKHVRSHRKYLHYSCNVCFKTFSNPNATRLHKSEHKDSDYSCTGCNTYFKCKPDLDKHVTAFYKNMWKRKVPELSPKDNLTCTICNKAYKTFKSLSCHLTTHTERKRDHICEICGKGFYDTANLNEHMTIHNAKLHLCEICKRSFKTIYKLREHAEVHSGIKPFTCNECDKSFRLKRHLADHMLIHTDSLPHVCSVCDKRFRRQSYLKNHLRQHTGVKPYSCDICPRDFTNWPNWHKHMKQKHGIETAKRKRTSQGLYAVDAATGKIIYPESDKVHEWKKKIKEPQLPRGPKIRKTAQKVEICQD